MTDGRSPVLSRLLCDTAGDQPTLARRSVIALRGLIEAPRASQRASERTNERVGSVMDAKEKRKTAEAAVNKNKNQTQTKLTNHCERLVLPQAAQEKFIGPVSHSRQSSHQVMQQMQHPRLGDSSLTGRSPAHPADSQHGVHSSFSCRCSASQTSSWRPCHLNEVCCAGSMCEKIGISIHLLYRLPPALRVAGNKSPGKWNMVFWNRKIIAAFRRTVTANFITRLYDS